MRRAGLVAALAAAWPASAAAEPGEDAPFERGVTTLDLELSSWGLFDPNLTSLGFSLGARRYLLNGLALGLSLSDTIVFYRDAFEARHPGIASQLPTNMLEIMPLLQYVFFRSRWFSPYVYGGVGPVFFNHGGGTHGQWSGGPGVYVHVRGPIFASLGVGFSGLFPGGRCNDALLYQPQGSTEPGVPVDLCSFRWGPQLGVTLAFGGRGRERRPSRPAEPRAEAPRFAPIDPPVDAEAPPPPVLDPPPPAATPRDAGSDPRPPTEEGETAAPSSVSPDTAPGTTDVPGPTPAPRTITTTRPGTPRAGLPPRSADRPTPP